MIKNEWSHTEETQEIVDKVGVLINQLKQVNLSGHVLVEIETKLAAYYAYLASKTSENQTSMNARYWMRKIAYGKKYALLRHKSNQGDSKVGAEGLIEDEINDELEANFRFEFLKAFCKGIELNLISIAHRLKQLNSEAVNSKHVNH